jgi:rhodanese-related sulfurtransferase
MGQAIERMKEIPADRPKAVLCAGGLRSSSVISALLRSGMSGWYNVAGGMREWSKAGYPTVKPGGSHSGA